MSLHPLYKHYLKQILSFGSIWLIFGLVYIILERGIMGGIDTYPSTGNKYSFYNSLFTLGIGSFVTGLIQGTIEVLWLKKYFTHKPFWFKILFKSLFYIFFIIASLVVLTLITNAQLYNTSVFAPVVVNSLIVFVNQFSFWSVIIYTSMILDIALFYSEIKNYLGKNVLSNYFGKYHKPIQETRIFMFLDMKSSTSIAESLGHKQYFKLLKMYYSDMTNAILETSGEIYQYVGDEIVVTWKESSGIHKNNCIHCFRKIANALDKKSHKYIKRFGLVPEFKAGYHIGSVTTGEIGTIKKDLIHTGDILNTSARIQEKCNTLDASLLISEALYKTLKKDDLFSITKIENLLLRGKKQSIQLYKVVFN